MGSGLSATPLRTPFAAPKAGATTVSDEEAQELRRKVARLKKLLGAANAHIDKLKAEAGAGG